MKNKILCILCLLSPIVLFLVLFLVLPYPGNFITFLLYLVYLICFKPLKKLLFKTFKVKQRSDQ